MNNSEYLGYTAFLYEIWLSKQVSYPYGGKVTDVVITLPLSLIWVKFGNPTMTMAEKKILAYITKLYLPRKIIHVLFKTRAMVLYQIYNTR